MIKDRNYIFCLFIGLISAACSEHGATGQAEKDSLFHRPEGIVHRIQNPSEYDSLFIEGLKAYKENINLRDSMIITGKDTIPFPSGMKKNRQYHFYASKAGYRYDLKTRPLNLTTVEFFFLKSKNGRPEHVEKGKAVLEPFFFNGTYAVDDPETGEIFPVHLYLTDTTKTSLTINYSTEPDTAGRLRAVVSLVKNRNGSIDKETSPVLKAVVAPSM